MSRNQSLTALSIIITEDDEHVLELTLVMRSNNLKDSGQVVIGEVGGKSKDGVDEVVDSGSGRRTRSGNQERARVVTPNLDDGTRVRGLVDAAQLLKDRDPNPGLKSHLVPDADSFQTAGQWDLLVAAEEPRVDVTDALRSIDGVHLNVQDWNTRCLVPDRIRDVQDLEIDVDAMGGQHELQKLGHLLASRGLPLTLIWNG